MQGRIGLGWRSRRGEAFIEDECLYPIEQESSLELPLGYDVDEDIVRPKRPIGIILHVFYIDLLAEFGAYLAHIPFPADLFISTDTDEKRGIISAFFAGWPLGRVSVKVVPNRGRDIAPKLVEFADVHEQYEYVLHLHTKQSPHDARLVGWRGYLLDALLGSPEVVRGVFACFARAPRLGMLAPQHIDDLRPWIRWGQNYTIAETVAEQIGFHLPPHAPLDFPSGSMFWARSAALRPLLDLRLSFESFSQENGQTDGTLAHAVERLYFHVCEWADHDWIKITAAGQLHDQRGVVTVANQVELDRFLTHAPLRLSRIGESRLGQQVPLNALPQRKPRRMMHVLWRQVLGDGRNIPAGTRLAIVLHGEAADDDKLARSAHLATTSLPHGVIGDVIRVGSNSPEGPTRNDALRTGFVSGADVVLLLCRPGLLHPGSGAAVLRMALEQAGAVMIEGSYIADPVPHMADPQSLTQTWAGGPVLAFTRSLFEATEGFALEFTGEAAERELSARALGLGFAILRCPLCLFTLAERR